MDLETYDRLADMAEREEDDSLEYWQHGEEGDTVRGLVAGMMRGLQAKSGNLYDVLALRDPRTGRLTGVPLWRKALAGKIQDLRPRIGEVVVIVYLGMAETRAGTSFHNYKVICVDKDGNRVFRREDDGEELGEPTAEPMSEPMTEWDAVHGETPSTAPASSAGRRTRKLREELELDMPF